MKYILLLLLGFIFSQFAYSQIDTTINPTDTTLIRTKKKKEKKPMFAFLRDSSIEAAPKKAAFYSSIFPGGGQIYNKQYYKAPIALGGVGFVAYLAVDFTREYRRYRDAYRLRVDGDPTTIDEFDGVAGATDDAIEDIRDQYRKWMEQSYIGLIAIHALNAVEAYVARHLRDFKIEDDLPDFPKIELSTFSDETGAVSFGLKVGLYKSSSPTPPDFLNFEKTP